MPLQGQCLCGKIQINVKDAGLPLKPVVCRCTNCQTTAGSLFSLVAMLPEEHVEIKGEPKSFEDNTTGSGNVLYRRFCGDCGTPIQSVSPSRAGLAIIKMGVFAKSEAYGKDITEPVMQIFTKNKKSFETLIEGVPAVETTAK